MYLSVWLIDLRQYPWSFSKAFRAGTISWAGIIFLIVMTNCLVLGVWCLLQCLTISAFLLYDLWHISHRNGFSSMWITLCLTKLFFFKNAFWHISHTNVFSRFSLLLPPCWVNWWFCRLRFCINVAQQMSHMNGPSTDLGIVFSHGISVSHWSKSTSKSVLLSSILINARRGLVDFWFFVGQGCFKLARCMRQAGASYADGDGHEESRPVLLLMIMIEFS